MSTGCGGRAFASRLGFELFRTRPDPDLLSASCMRRAFAEMDSSGRFGAAGRLKKSDGGCGGAAGSADADCTARFEDEEEVGDEGGGGEIRDIGRDEPAPMPVAVVLSRSRSRTNSW